MESKFLELKLRRAVEVARKTMVLARALLQASEGMEQVKMEEIGRWLTESEKDLELLSDSNVGTVLKDQSNDRSGRVFHQLLPQHEQDLLKRYPERSYAVALESLESGTIAQGALVEIVCRIPDGETVLRSLSPENRSLIRCAPGKIVVVQESAQQGVQWALALARAILPYVGAGPELTLVRNAAVYVVRVNSNGWWKGLLASDGTSGIFPATSVVLEKVYSAPMGSFLKLLAPACREKDAEFHPSAKLKLAMSGATHDRGAEEVSAFHVHAWNEARTSQMPPLFLSTCWLQFPLLIGAAVTRQVRFTCPETLDTEGVDSELNVKILLPRLGPNLEKTSCSVEPSTFKICEGETVDVRISFMSSGPLDVTSSAMIPVLIFSNDKPPTIVRYFLYCELTTEQLRKQDRLSSLISDDHTGSDVWGETMSTSDLAAAGIKDLLSDLLGMPATKSPVPPTRAPRPSAQQAFAVATSPTGSTPSPSPTPEPESSDQNSPRGAAALANVRVRLGRNRSQSSGGEEEVSRLVERKSPRSPRLDDSLRSSKEGQKSPRFPPKSPDVPPRSPDGLRGSKGTRESRSSSTSSGGPPTRPLPPSRPPESAVGSAVNQLILEPAPSPIVLGDGKRREIGVRVRDSPQTERKPGWVASIDRRPTLTSSKPPSKPLPDAPGRSSSGSGTVDSDVDTAELEN